MSGEHKPLGVVGRRGRVEVLMRLGECKAPAQRGRGRTQEIREPIDAIKGYGPLSFVDAQVR